MQRDELCPVLTVMEYMQYAVDLKIGDHLCIQRKKQLVRDDFVHDVVLCLAIYV